MCATIQPQWNIYTHGGGEGQMKKNIIKSIKHFPSVTQISSSIQFAFVNVDAQSAINFVLIPAAEWLFLR